MYCLYIYMYGVKTEKVKKGGMDIGNVTLNIYKMKDCLQDAY